MFTLISKANPLFIVKRLKDKSFVLGFETPYVFASETSVGYKAFKKECITHNVNSDDFRQVPL